MKQADRHNNNKIIIIYNQKNKIKKKPDANCQENNASMSSNKETYSNTCRETTPVKFISSNKRNIIKKTYK